MTAGHGKAVDEVDERVKRIFNELVEAEPLKYVWHYVHVTLDGIDKADKYIGDSEDYKDYMKNEQYKDKVKVVCNHLRQMVYFDKYTKIIEIKPELKDMLFYTKNKIFARKPFYNQMFFNVDVELEGYTVKGFYVEWIEHLQDMNILYVAVKKDTFHEFWGNFGFIPNEKDTEGVYVDNKKEERIIFKIRDEIRMIIANILDFINHPQDKIEVINQERNDKINIKRMKNNKHPINSKMWLRPHPLFRDYLVEYNKRIKCDYAFTVRGHWRHFHADRFKVDKPIWIDPFIKNKDKDYENKRVVMSK